MPVRPERSGAHVRDCSWERSKARGRLSGVESQILGTLASTQSP